MIERPIEFDRLRYMRCGTCSDEWEVDADWLDRFDLGDEPCPNCRTDCTSEDRPNFWVRPQDPVFEDAAAKHLYWYHSSTHAVWPDRNFDPTAQLTDDTKRRMELGGRRSGAVGRWAARQRSKALHVGTYEAAIENMLRRMDRQGDAQSQFWLHRVQLRPDCVFEPGVQSEPTDFMGDAQLAEKCGPGVNVLRYVNVHEDPSNVSLAIEISAVWRVQSIPIPLPVDADDPELRTATARLLAAVAKPAEQAPPEDSDPLARLRRRAQTAPLASEAEDLRKETSDRLPLPRYSRFNPWFDEAKFAADPSAFPAKLIGLFRLVSDPPAVTDALTKQPWRLV